MVSSMSSPPDALFKALSDPTRRAIFERLARTYPAVGEHRLDLAQGIDSLANLYCDTGRFGPAEEAYRRAEALLEQLRRADGALTELALALAGRSA